MSLSNYTLKPKTGPHRSSLPSSTPVGILKWPSIKPNAKQTTAFDLLRLGLQLINIPVYPQKLTLQELGLGAHKPNNKVRR